MATTSSTSTDPTTESGATAGFGSSLPVSPTDIRDAVDSVARTVPEVARTSRTVMEDWMQQIERSSDERVAAGVTLSLGLAVGMLIGGAPRILTALALIPVAAIGLVLLDRRNGVTPPKVARAG
jgi:hypothetical protein